MSLKRVKRLGMIHTPEKERKYHPVLKKSEVFGGRLAVIHTWCPSHNRCLNSNVYY